MVELLVLMGLGLFLTTLDSVEDPAEEEDVTDTTSSPEDPAVQEVTDTTNIIVSSQFAGSADQFLSTEQIDLVSSVDGAIEANTGSGNDVVIGGDENDNIKTGSGNDLVLGGAGNDEVVLDGGNDTYGAETTANDPNEALGNSEVGDDFVQGGLGNDVIVDQFGSNTLQGQGDDDTINAIDAEDEPTPDNVSGGTGDDILLVDQGDRVSTGAGSDTVTASISSEADPLMITITDFSTETDALQLQGISDADVVALTEFGSTEEGIFGTNVSVNGALVAEVFGATGLSVEDIILLP